MAAYNKFNVFVENIAEGVHDLGADTLMVFLSNSAPAATNTAYDGVTGSTGPAEIAAGNGYTAKGEQATISTSSQTSGTYTLKLANVTFTASGGTIGPFRYAVLFNDTAAGDPVIGWWDNGASDTLADGESVTVEFSPTNGVLQIA